MMVKRYYMVVEFDEKIGEDQIVSIEDSCGDYVEYEDYEALESDYNILRRDYEKLQQGIRDLYLES